MENLKKRITEIVIGVLIAILAAIIIPRLGISDTPQPTTDESGYTVSDPKTESEERAPTDSTETTRTNSSDDETPNPDGDTTGNIDPTPPTPTPPPPTPTKPSTPPVEEKSYLQITVNGEKRTYYGDSFDFSEVGYSSWYTFLNASKYSDNDSFYISLPPEISTGDVLLIKAKEMKYDGSWDDMGNLFDMMNQNYSIQYKDKSGNSYIIGTTPNGAFQLTIDEWQGRGGYAIGSLEGEIWPTSVDCIKFTNGTFKIKIKAKEY